MLLIILDGMSSTSDGNRFLRIENDSGEFINFNITQDCNNNR